MHCVLAVASENLSVVFRHRPQRKPPLWGGFDLGGQMEIFVYSDESGVFDYVHNEYFVYGGLIFLSKRDKDSCIRKHKHIEASIRENLQCANDVELKACGLKAEHKRRLFNSLNRVSKFGVMIHQSNLDPRWFDTKRDKQSYLDHAYTTAISLSFQSLIRNGDIPRDEVTAIRFFVDEHSTATKAKNDLRTALEQALKFDTYTLDMRAPPIFPRLNEVSVKHCNSAASPLVRAADIVANRIWREACEKRAFNAPNLQLFKLP